MIRKGKSHTHTIFLLSFIAGISAAALLYALVMFFLGRLGVSTGAVFFSVLLALLFEALGSAGVVLHWFSFDFLRPGRVINILQWIAGMLGVAAIFDGIMRFSRGAEWMVANSLPIVIDAVLVTLFILWMAVSHFIDKDAAERKACRFC